MNYFFVPSCALNSLSGVNVIKTFMHEMYAFLINAYQTKLFVWGWNPIALPPEVQGPFPFHDYFIKTSCSVSTKIINWVMFHTPGGSVIDI